MKKIVVATSQFDVTEDIARNSLAIQAQMHEAAAAAAKVVLFPECALSGYHGWTGLRDQDPHWAMLRRETRAIQAEAAKLGIWVVLGTVHQQGNNEKPRNSVLVINDKGEIVNRYDKRRLWGRDKDHYSVGCEPMVMSIDGVTCGFLICFDSGFPDLYVDYRSRGVELLFHSFFNAGNKNGETDLDTMIFSQQVTRASDYGLWIVVSNSSTPHSRLGAGFFGPDGSVKALLKGKGGIITTTLPAANIGWTYDNRAYDRPAN